MSTPDRTRAPLVTTVPPISLPATTDIYVADNIKIKVLKGGDQDLVRLTLLWEGGTLDCSDQSLPTLLFESMREGSVDRTGAEVADILDFNGARLISRVADHHSGLELFAIASKLQALLPMLADIINAPRLSADSIDTCARTVAAGLQSAMAKVSYQASRAIVPVLRGIGHPASTESTPESVMAITRASVCGLYDRYVHDGRLHVFLAGNVTDELLSSVIAFLSAIAQPTGRDNIVIVSDTPLPPERIKIERPESLQSAISMGLPTIGRGNPDYIKLRLAIIALGGYFSSRLMQNIREEKGLTYGINAHLLGSYEGASMRINAQTDAANVDVVIDETFNEIKRLVSDSLDEDELTRLKLNAWTSLASTVDSPFTAMDYYITELQVGTGPDYFERQLNEIRSLTSRTVADMISTYIIPENISIGICGR